MNPIPTRNISARQVKAADIYAGFPEKFKKAMDKLIDELSDTRGSDSKVSIVLPIDNIDRSTEHLQSIVKLAQLVSHPNLWLVMAGDRVEVETFLERGYWKELIRSSDGAGARGKMDSDGEDEALVMARRQANATAQKLWPANHRVEIDFLTPKQTLAFEYKQDSTVNTSKKIKELREIDVAFTEDEVAFAYKHIFFGDEKNDKSIRGMLKKIQIPTTDNQRESDNSETSAITLLDLFDVTDKVEEKENEKLRLTRAAHHGLSLPARSVLDLWQLLDWLVYDTSSERDFKAEKVARTMLRNVISCSDMSNAIAQDLQNYILRRGEKGGTILYFSGNTLLNVIPMTSANRDFEYALRPVFSIKTVEKIKHNFCSQLIISNIEDIILSLQYNYSPIKRIDKNQYPQPFVTENANDSEKRKIELPPMVSAWLMVLYDILILAETKASSWVVISNSKPLASYPNVSVHHTIIQAGKYKNAKPLYLYWTSLSWSLFLGRNIFSLRWKNFRKKIVENLSENTQQKRQNLEYLVPRLLAAGWIFCVLKTSFELIQAIDYPQFFPEKEPRTGSKAELQKKAWEFKDKLLRFGNLLNINNLLESEENTNSPKLEESMMAAINTLYQLIQEVKKPHYSSPKLEPRAINPAAYEVMIKTGKWLETELIYFSSSAYVPIDLKDVDSNKSTNPISKQTQWFKEMWKGSEKTGSLQEYWKNNLPFILAEQEEKLAEVENKSKDGRSESSKDNGDTGKPKSLAELLFTDLYQLLDSLDK